MAKLTQPLIYEVFNLPEADNWKPPWPLYLVVVHHCPPDYIHLLTSPGFARYEPNPGYAVTDDVQVRTTGIA